MLELVDTHCHIQSIAAETNDQAEHSTRELWAKAEALSPDGVIQAAIDSGVTKMICVGCDLADSRLAVDFVQNRPACWASIGIHPHEADSYVGQTDKLAEFSHLLSGSKIVAIGECGLDYFYNHSDKSSQQAILRFQIELAIKHDLPMIFHVRDAFDDFWQIYDEYQPIRGVLHSYTDNLENLQKALDRKLFIGVNGIATFAKDSGQLDVYRAVPLDSLVLETDSPFLTPTPYRGTINEPKRVVNIADFVADLRDLDLEKLSALTTSNARNLFGV